MLIPLRGWSLVVARQHNALPAAEVYFKGLMGAVRGGAGVTPGADEALRRQYPLADKPKHTS